MQSRKAENKIHRVSTSDFKQPDRFVTFSLGKEDCLETECCSFRGIERNPWKCSENEWLEATSQADGTILAWIVVQSARAEFYTLIVMYRWRRTLQVSDTKR